jgi:hypothetical protein
MECLLLLFHSLVCTCTWAGWVHILHLLSALAFAFLISFLLRSCRKRKMIPPQSRSSYAPWASGAY